MRLKLLALVLITAALSILAVRTSSKLQQPVRIPEKDRLQWFARKAREEGKKQVVLPGPTIDYAGIDMDLDQALRDYSVEVAEPIANKSYIANSDDVRTWYKFRILETLTRRNSAHCYTCPPVPNPPIELSTTNPEEFLISASGGTVILDGVAVTVDNRSIPPFENGKKYLLFLSLEPSGVAVLGTGPSSVFRLIDDDSMVAVNNDTWRIQAEISKRFNLKLSELKSHLRN
jgi:hypothetical protein